MHHDSWVYLNPNNPFGDLAQHFPQGIPVRDPFPLSYSWFGDEIIPLWAIDVTRLNNFQIKLLAKTIAKDCQTNTKNILAKVFINGVLNFPHKYIGRLRCGFEGLQRIEELKIFRQYYGENVGQTEFSLFVRSQYQNWIQTNRQFSKYPSSPIFEVSINILALKSVKKK